jgi:hypothetical protein
MAALPNVRMNVRRCIAPSKQGFREDGPASRSLQASWLSLTDTCQLCALDLGRPRATNPQKMRTIGSESQTMLRICPNEQFFLNHFQQPNVTWTATMISSQSQTMRARCPRLQGMIA